MRAVPEWIGKTDDAKIPEKVRLRIIDSQGGKCALTGVKFGPKDPAEIDHIKALWLGGEHRQSNLHAITRAKHREKTDAEATTRAKTASVKAKHVLPRPEGKIKSPGFAKTEKATKTSRHPTLPRRSLFAPSPTREFDNDDTD